MKWVTLSESGVCASCLRLAPEHLRPAETIVSPLAGNNSMMLCDWCSVTRRVSRLGQRLRRDEPSTHLLTIVMHAILLYLVWLMGGAHDEDEELVECRVTSVKWAVLCPDPCAIPLYKSKAMQPAA